jgi:lipopolysaccharide biosynthesis regulator YciM
MRCSRPRSRPRAPRRPTSWCATSCGANPTLLGLDRLLEAQIVGAEKPERRHDLELVRSLVHSHTQRLARYRCENCGFKARQFYWVCPACGGWETYPPRRSRSSI